MTLKKTKLSLAEVKENIQQSEMTSKKRSEKDLSTKERDLFKTLYKMSTNEQLAAKFSITTEGVERLAHELKVCKNPSFTRSRMTKSKQGDWTHPSIKEGTTPSYLIDRVSKKLTEEERREFLTKCQEKKDPVKALRDLAMIQEVRIARGFELEMDSNQMWRVVNDAVDSYHAIQKSIFEMENDTNLGEANSFDRLILERQNKN